MTHYIGLLDGKDGGYGIVIPDLPGCNAMGDTVEAAIRNATLVMSDWAEVTELHDEAVPAPRSMAELNADPEVAEAIDAGVGIVFVPMIRGASRPVKTNLSLDSGVLAAIDATAKRLGVTRSGLVELLAKRGLSELA